MYTGYVHMNLTDEQISQFYLDDSFLLDYTLPNQYVVLFDGEDNLLDIRVNSRGRMERLCCYEIANEWTGKIKPRNLEQKLAFDMLARDDIRVKVLTGTHGSGKDLLMSNFAMTKVLRGQYDKIVWVRNNVELADTVPLGALPGDVKDKIIDFAMPLADHVGGVDALNQLIGQDKLELVHLGHLRGRDLRNCILYCSEAENLTTRQVQLLLGRVGEGSAIYLNGDYRQADRRIFEKDNGLMRMIEVLQGEELFGYVKLVKSERSEVSRLADLLDKEREEEDKVNVEEIYGMR